MWRCFCLKIEFTYKKCKNILIYMLKFSLMIKKIPRKPTCPQVSNLQVRRRLSADHLQPIPGDDIPRTSDTRRFRPLRDQLVQIAFHASGPNSAPKHGIERNNSKLPKWEESAPRRPESQWTRRLREGFLEVKTRLNIVDFNANPVSCFWRELPRFKAQIMVSVDPEK